MLEPDRSCYEAATEPVRAFLNGNVARRKFDSAGHVWDTELPGFALRHFASGAKTWMVQYRHRGETRRELLGDVGVLSVAEARRGAKAVLARAALDGLPMAQDSEAGKVDVLFRDYAPIFWRHVSPRWKTSTRKSELVRLKGVLIPAFGDRPLASLTKADILAWRDSMARREGTFNRSLPLLSGMLHHAEILGHRRPGSNPCKGTPRYKRRLKERYLSPREFEILGAVLRRRTPKDAACVAIIWLLIYTGARKHEITDLRWEWIGSDYVDLPDSKTGPKRLYLNRQANAVLDRLGRRSNGEVFKDHTPRSLELFWTAVRGEAQLDGLRMHDLRHSFASVALMRGVSLSFIGSLLGHVLPETTARYAHLADESISEAAQRVCASLAATMGLAR